jgi:hypothetical protein
VKEVVESFQVVEKLERETGLEPATSSLGSWHSTTELLPPLANLPFNSFQAALSSEQSVYPVALRPENRHDPKYITVNVSSPASCRHREAGDRDHRP